MKLQQLSLSDLYGLKKSIDKTLSDILSGSTPEEIKILGLSNGSTLNETDPVRIAIQLEINSREEAIIQEIEEAPIKEKTPTIVRKGYGQAVTGLTLLVNTQNDEIVRVDFKNREEQWKYYCKYLKVTIEVIDESEIEED